MHIDISDFLAFLTNYLNFSNLIFQVIHPSLCPIKMVPKLWSVLIGQYGTISSSMGSLHLSRKFHYMMFTESNNEIPKPRHASHLNYLLLLFLQFFLYNFLLIGKRQWTYFSVINLFVTSKNESTNSPILQFNVLQNVFWIL